MLLVLNSHHDVVDFTLPECAGGPEWTRLIDTNPSAEGPEFVGNTGDVYSVTARSSLLFVKSA